jgi:molecular chaperone DnaJ
MGPGARGGFGGGGGGFPGGFQGGNANFGGNGFEDVFANLFGGGGGGFGGPRGPQRGQDLTTTQTLDFIDGVKGTTIKLSLRAGAEPTTIKIPAGVTDGQKIKIAGKGNPSPNGGPAGDLIITVTVKPHPVFTRDGNNIRVVVPITFAEAVLGATIQVPTLGGEPVKLKVAPGTPNGRVLRVKGRGVVTAKAEGDLLATVEIAVPSHVSDKAKKALEEFDGFLPDEDPRADLLLRAGLL